MAGDISLFSVIARLDQISIFNDTACEYVNRRQLR
jgi:hypothetical protein